MDKVDIYGDAADRETILPKLPRKVNLPDEPSAPYGNYAARPFQGIPHIITAYLPKKSKRKDKKKS